jgi:hypothetical protein
MSVALKVYVIVLFVSWVFVRVSVNVADKWFEDKGVPYEIVLMLSGMLKERRVGLLFMVTVYLFQACTYLSE